MRYMKGRSKRRGDNRLPMLAAAINERHDAVGEAAHTMVGHAAECGRLLIEAKASLGHGGWLPWVQENLRFGPRQAQKYMRIAGKIDALPNANSNSHLSVDEVLQLVAEPPPLPAPPVGEYRWSGAGGVKLLDLLSAPKQVTDACFDELKKIAPACFDGTEQPTGILLHCRVDTRSVFIWPNAFGSLTFVVSDDTKEKVAPDEPYVWDYAIVVDLGEWLDYQGFGNGIWQAAHWSEKQTSALATLHDYTRRSMEAFERSATP